MTTPVHDLLVTTPDRLKAAWRALLARIEAAGLRLIDRFLARRDEERAPRLLAFDELPVLYDEADFPVVEDDIGWSGSSLPESRPMPLPTWHDYA